MRPHAHCARFTPDSSRLLVIDLGLDRLFAYEIDALGQLAADPARGFAFEPGRGPRHLAFHPDGQTLFVVHEVRCGITALRFEDGLTRHVQTRDVVYNVLGQPSAIVVSPDGRHVYIAVRGPGEVVGFSVEAGGKLDEIGRWPCGGTWPRDMVLTPSGGHLVVCNQDTDTVAVLARDGETGALGPASPALSIGTPMRLVFA
jgi:6-phosphogluconolactonase